MDNTTEMTVYTPQLQLFGDIIVGLTTLQGEVQAEVMNALRAGEPIRRTMAYATGPVDSSAWFVALKPGHDFGRLEVEITCKDDVVQTMIMSVLPRESLYLDARDMRNDAGGDVIQCTIAGVLQNHANQYADQFGTLVW